MGPYEKWYRDLCQKVENVVEKVNIEYADHLENTLRTNYKRIITYWYSQYNPTYYDRRGSLYDLIYFKHDSSTFIVGFDPSKISYRNGYNDEDGLYNQVFILGYHGGANLGSKSYLIPYTYPALSYNGEKAPWDPKPWNTDEHKGITHGWEQAQRSMSPYRMWQSFVDHYNKKQYQTDYDTILAKYVRNLF